MNETNEIEKINIWETKYKNKTIHFNDIDDFINFLEQENKYNYEICERHMPSEQIKLTLDQASTNQNICLTYTDNNHQVTIIDFGFIGKDIIVHPDFYKKYQDKLITYSKQKVLKCIEEKKIVIYIPNNIITDDLINTITSNEDLIGTTFIISQITDSKLTNDQIKKIKEAHLELYYGKEQISTNKLIDYYSRLDLKDKKNLRIYSTHPLNEIENFIYLNDNCEITIAPKFLKDNHTYLNDIIKIIDILSKHNKTYNIKIEIENRELLKKSGILNAKNINFIIHNDLYDYKKEELLNEEEILDNLVKPIKKAKLSPYEKYLAVYSIVKQFKPYKENNDNKEQSRYLRYILNNDYIVCVGYSKLLKTLLNKVEIPCTEISVGIDISYDDGFTKEEKEIDLQGHARNIIKIDDDKYNIHGIYIADSTWDNDMGLDLYQNSTLTFDKKKEAKRLESLTNKDLLLDFHDFEEFTKKINYYLKKEIQNEYKFEKDFSKRIYIVYNKIYQEIMTLLIELDYHKYQELYQKYHKLLNDNKNNTHNLEKIYSDFLTDYAQYIIPLSNKSIDNSTLLEAAINTKKTLHKYKKDELEQIKDNLISNYIKYENLEFPYQYDPNNKNEGYLETKSSKKK